MTLVQCVAENIYQPTLYTPFGKALPALQCTTLLIYVTSTCYPPAIYVELEEGKN